MADRMGLGISRRRRLALVLCATWWLMPLSGLAEAEEKPTKKDMEFFEKKIRPVLVQKCYSCHSQKSKKAKGGLLLDTREGIRRGGETGHAVVPGSLEESVLLEAINYEGLEMPPDEQLSDSVIADFEKWIESGAADPRDGKAAPIRRNIDFKTARQFWSLLPLSTDEVPSAAAGWARDDVDRYVMSQLLANGLQPADDASPAVLIRRVYFDLVGLPPSPDVVAAFVKSPTQQHYTRIVDGLLDSPQFGERWGRHWLDVVRYAESTGMERNYTFPFAWRYRDYVIRAFNEDKPFDRFIHEQIAGDLLAFKTDAERKSNITATGVLALGPKSLNERNREKFLMDVVDDQIDLTTRAFLGITAACARCHDHKFDPIPTSEYYALAGIFRSTATLYGTGGNRGNRQSGGLFALAKPGAAKPGSAASDKPATDKVVQNSAGQKKKASAALRAETVKLKKLQRQLQQLRGVGKGGQTAATKKRRGKKNARKRTARATGKKAAADPQKIAALQKQIQQTQRRLRTLRQKGKKKGGGQAKYPPGTELAMAVREGPSISHTTIRIRGEVNERGDEVPRGFLTIGSLAQNAISIPEGVSGRLQLAHWITSEDNPLTARVAVNRVWQHMFGQGIVGSVNNFGVTGDRPTHPELLDALAGQFAQDGWSVKRLIRRLALSRTYQMSSAFNEKAFQQDAENSLLWRMSPRRLDAESLRDAILHVSGQLDSTPQKASIVQEIGDGDIGRSLQPQRFAQQSNKRSVYLPIVRGVVPELLRTFDFPEPSIIFGRRDETTVPTQALYMLNSPFVVQQSQQTAKRLLAIADTDDRGRITTAYQLAFSRPPTVAELDRSTKFVAKLRGDESREQLAWTGFCQALFAAAEFRYID